MSIWHVQIWGEGFLRDGQEASFELAGIVRASDPESAFRSAVALAKKENPELLQAEHPPGPGAVINAEEIVEFSDAPASEIGNVEIFWDSKKNM